MDSELKGVAVASQLHRFIADQACVMTLSLRTTGHVIISQPF